MGEAWCAYTSQVPIVMARASIDHTICLRPFGPTQSLSRRLVFLNCQRPIKIPKLARMCGVEIAFLESLILHSKREWDINFPRKKQQPRAKVWLSAFPLRLLLSLIFCRHDEVGRYIHASHIQSLHCRSKYWSSRRDHQPRQLLSDEGEKTKPISQVDDQRPIDPRPWAQEAFPKQREGATTRTVCALTSNAGTSGGGMLMLMKSRSIRVNEPMGRPPSHMSPRLARGSIPSH